MTTSCSRRAATLALALLLPLSLAACSNGSGMPDGGSGLDLTPIDSGGSDTAAEDTAFDTVSDPVVGPDTVATPDVVMTADLPGDVTTPPPDLPPCNNGDIDTLDTSQSGLLAFIMTGDYKCWLAEPAVHESAGPHAVTGVRTFFNDKVAASLRAGTGVHPRGSILVKELYNGPDIMGYAIDVKDTDGTGASNWIFYEGFAPSFNGYYGRANSTCTGCHSQGVDYVRSRLP
jgi:hypothetical protein